MAEVKHVQRSVDVTDASVVYEQPAGEQTGAEVAHAHAAIAAACSAVGVSPPMVGGAGALRAKATFTVTNGYTFGGSLQALQMRCALFVGGTEAFSSETFPCAEHLALRALGPEGSTKISVPLSGGARELLAAVQRGDEEVFLKVIFSLASTCSWAEGGRGARPGEVKCGFVEAKH